MYSFWVNAHAFQRGAGFRLDLLLLNPVAAARLRAAGVDQHCRGGEKPSDHAPVWIELAPEVDVPRALTREMVREAVSDDS
jgi:exodeoxyribonuclease-3